MPAPKFITVINNASYVIAGAGVTLPPNSKTRVAWDTFTKAFSGADGKPSSAAAKHFTSAGPGKPAALTVVTTRAIPSLDTESAVQAVADAEAEELPLLTSLLTLEERPMVRAALAERVKALTPAPKEEPKAHPAVPAPVAQASTPPQEARPQPAPAPSAPPPPASTPAPEAVPTQLSIATPAEPKPSRRRSSSAE